jgi:hypothetical protein
MPKEVCDIIAAWRDGAMSDEALHLWATNNYFPLHQPVAPGSPDQVALAIGIVLTEFECTRPPYPFGRDVADFAIHFIAATPEESDKMKAAFLSAVQRSNHADAP